MKKQPIILWFRRDLRLLDNPALKAATDGRRAIVPVFIWAPEEEGAWAPGAASRWWLHHSLLRLTDALEKCGSRLILRRGPSLDAIRRLVREAGASAVYWNRLYEPALRSRDEALEDALHADGVEAAHFNASLLFEPESIRTKQNGSYKVFTPFWKACLDAPAPRAPEPKPRSIPAPGRWPDSVMLDDLQLLPRIDWAGGLRETWTPGESGAQAALQRFAGNPLLSYLEGQNRPDLQGTSRLSPHLHFGEISPRQVFSRIRAREELEAEASPGASRFLTEIGWREFACHLLFHFPESADSPLRREFAKFKWRDDEAGLKAWQQGRTGYPIVDAGMRQLWRTGWMHNRVRMIAASFLTKDLRIHWLEGARWFWETLVDADLANNTLGWQWTAGCGADAAPFFRIFNPVTQGEKFDPDGAYARRWIPELRRLSNRWIHQPWRAPREELERAGVRLGETCAAPIVDHVRARNDALRRYEFIAKR